MPQLFTNNAITTLASNISAVATSLTVASGTGVLFPAPTGDDFFFITLIGTNYGAETSWEIIKVTSRSSDTFTIVRAQESTGAASWVSGVKVELRLTAGVMNTISGYPVSIADGGNF